MWRIVQCTEPVLGVVSGRLGDATTITPTVCRSLALDEKSMHDISGRHGHGSADVVRKAFTRRFGVRPTEDARHLAERTAPKHEASP
ncbi:hypothetical protein MK974_31585 [Burkholderia ambifaria]|uniref:hypothetical protein n=1 Tax=Burkholderia ambifaria TaxID=152480 RepID=UPI0022A99632|nr:hypothetical protein [Burkholderia ambifaria]WAS58386.1 hypothetical protein MK974_31585 [Burkholderia ambifaria]